VDGGTAEEDGCGYAMGHARVVKFCETERGLAQLAVFLLRVREPLHEAFLVHIFDASAAFARVEQRLVWAALAAANATGVDIVFVWGVMVGRIDDGRRGGGCRHVGG